MIPPPDALPDDPATLKEIILAQRAEALRMAASVRAYEALIQALRIRIAKLKRQKFGSSSEKIEREIEQLQLALEDLEVAMATAETAAPAEAVATPEAPSERALPRRRGKPRIGQPAFLDRSRLAPGLTHRRIEHPDGRIVGMQAIAAHHVGPDPLDQRPEHGDRLAAPVDQRRTWNVGALSRQDLALAIQREVIVVLGDEDVGEQARAGHAARDRAHRRRRLV